MIVSPEKAIDVKLTTYVTGQKTSPDDLSATAWGAPNKDGLVVGLRLTPDKPSYGVGDVIVAEVVVTETTQR